MNGRNAYIFGTGYDRVCLRFASLGACVLVGLCLFSVSPAMSQGIAPAAPFTTEVRKRPARQADPPAERAALPAGTPQIQMPLAEATALDIQPNGLVSTRLVVVLTQPVLPQVFVLADPYRVIVDVPNLLFRLPRTSAMAGSVPAKALVTGYRYGMLTAEQSRLVFDVSGPVKIGHVETTQAIAGGPVHLTIDIMAIDQASFMASQQPPAARPAPPLAEPAIPRVVQAEGRPVIMIDPGHGGIDPGAVQGGIYEKDVALAVSRLLQGVLARRGLYDVRMTRAGDTFVALDQRVELSRAQGAALFISIHADTVGDLNVAQSVRGASVYTLSDRASNRQAQALAEKENAADARAGLGAAGQSADDQVKGILFDLMKRETQNFSSQFKNILIGQLRQSAGLAREPARSAAFKVLQQPTAPSVLVELGYMSNAQDAGLLTSPEWQGKVAASIAQAVDAYFKQRVAGR